MKDGRRGVEGAVEMMFVLGAAVVLPNRARDFRYNFEYDLTVVVIRV